MASRKDYVAVSEILAGYHQAMIDNFWWEDLINDFALLFEADNPKFKRDKFIEACNAGV